MFNQDDKMKEAERIHVEEEEVLRKQMNSKKAKEEAERLHQVITQQLYCFFICFLHSA